MNKDAYLISPSDRSRNPATSSTPAYTRRYTVNGWPDQVSGVELSEAVPEGYLPVVRGEGPVVLVPIAALTEVPPPIPPEPKPGAYLIGDILAVRFRNHPGYTQWFYGNRGKGCDETDSWESVWGDLGGPDVPVVRLVPEPAPVELPWHGRDVSVVSRTNGTISSGQTGRWLEMSPTEAEAKGWALITAARAAREVAP